MVGWRLAALNAVVVPLAREYRITLPESAPNLVTGAGIFTSETSSQWTAPSTGESGTNRTPSLRGRRSIHQLDRYRRDIRRLGRQRRYGFDCDVRGMIMPGIESRNQGGRDHATQPDPDQNLACRPVTVPQQQTSCHAIEKAIAEIRRRD